MRGRLLVVATPIGNLDELSPRARDALEAADVVACEDTRRTGRLFELAGIGHRPDLVSLHEHNERERSRRLVERCVSGETVVLVSDAGMPTISDPGARLVAEAHAFDVEVSVVSGPSAVVSALAVSGFAADRFVFEGFLPRKGKERARVLAAIAAESRTVVAYESPHRVTATVEELRDLCGGTRRVAIVRELSKMHEEVWRGTTAEAVEWLASSSTRGEFVLVIDGAAPPAPVDDDRLRDALADLIASGTSRRDAATEVADRFGVSKRRAYALVNES